LSVRSGKNYNECPSWKYGLDHVKKETVEKCIKNVGKKFDDHPLSFLTESDIKLEIASSLRDEEKNDNVQEVRLEKKDVTKYKEGYIQRMVNSKLVSYVHTEVNVGENGEDSHIDIGIFRNHVEGVINDGTKRFKADCLEHALEIKFIKNQDNVGIDHFEDETEKFLDRLDPSTQKYLIVFSNKNALSEGKRSKKGKKAKRTLEKKAEEIGFEFYNFYPKT